MPIAGKGMLMTSMDVRPEHEAELNAWYDREHLAERVAIEGFLEARRYVAIDARPRYLGLYSTATFDVLDSPAYRRALANQTDWSKRNIGRFLNMGRAVARITASRGQGRGAVLGLVRLRPARATERLQTETERLRAEVAARLDPGETPGLVAGHLMESDPGLSRSLTEPDRADPGAADWHVLIDGTGEAAVAAAAAELRERPPEGATLVSAGTYRLLWDLAKADL